MFRPRIRQADLFLLENWQEDSPLSMDAQREEIFAKYVALGVRGREPYRNQQRKIGDLPTHSQEFLDRIRLPAERSLNDGPCWIRTFYDPSSDDAWAQIQEYIDTSILLPPTVYNDLLLYNFGSNWEKIFLRAPQLLDNKSSVEDHEEYIKEALEEGIESENMDAEDAEEEGYDSEGDIDPWICFYSEYLFRLAVRRMHVVDKRTLASKGPDAGTVLVIWFDECGRVIRYYREEAREAVRVTDLDPCYAKDHPCWEYVEIGESYQWGAPLGPPYSTGEH
ncbi:hypothetical protein N7488_008879 [Penicillium malachiteum]|nr:hypothetical protein N7488_008879 [Penicillium malachiteum]